MSLGDRNGRSQRGSTHVLAPAHQIQVILIAEQVAHQGEHGEIVFTHAPIASSQS